MTEETRINGMMDRRRFLKLLGAAGATGAVVSACGTAPVAQAPAPTCEPCPTCPPAPACPVAEPCVPEGMKAVFLYADGPGGNLGWKSGDALKYVPAEKIPNGPAADLVAALPKEKLLDIYTKMIKARKWETTMKDLFVSGSDGLYGAFHVYIGEEGISSGVMSSLNTDDYIVSTHRGHGHLIAKGGDLNKMSAEIFFRKDGYNKGYGGSMHITDLSLGILGMNGIVGASFYIATGAAYGAGLVRKTKQVAVAFAGDGAANSVYYFSAVRNAVNYNLPVIYVIENNFQGITIPMATVTPTKQVSDYVKGLGLPAQTIDGNDVTAVYAAAAEAVDRARNGGGPSMIECMTYRWYDHAGFAGAKVGQEGAIGLPYRTDEEVRTWMSRDPILRFQNFLLERNLVAEADLTQIDTDTQAAVDASVEFARQSPLPDQEAGLLNVYAASSPKATQF
jgi:TPP-dependent pyruvate/acetoin dehydrogenase alpha subunit